MKRLRANIGAILDDLFILAGCGLILAGCYAVLPVLTWFVAGIMCLVIGVLIGIGRKGK